MDIFETNYSINKEKLIGMGFEEDGWGSLMTRKEKNTTIYEKFDELKTRNTTEVVDFIYFPNDWEGVYIHKCHPCDMRGYFLAIVGDDEQYRMYVSSILHIEMFIEKIKKHNKKELEEYTFDIPRFKKTLK